MCINRTSLAALQCAAASTIWLAMPAKAAVLVNDSLTTGTGIGTAVGGRFESEGWRSTSKKDRLYYALPNNLLQGSVEFEVKGWFNLNQGSDRRHVWGLYDVYRKSYSFSNPDYNGFTIRIYFKVYAGHPPGATRLRLMGTKYKKTQADSGQLSWDTNRWYRIKITWTQTNAKWSRDGQVVKRMTYPDKNTVFRYVILNSDNHGGLPGVSDAVYRNVVITDDPNFSGIPPPSSKSGDANEDSMVDMADLNMLVDWILGRSAEPNPGETVFTNSDVDGDSVIGMSDLNLLVDYLLGRITQFPID